MSYTPTPYQTTELTAPDCFAEYCGFAITFRYAAYHPWGDGTGGHFLECWQDGEYSQDWDVSDLAEAQRILKDLTLEDIGIEECED